MEFESHMSSIAFDRPSVVVVVVVEVIICISVKYNNGREKKRTTTRGHESQFYFITIFLQPLLKHAKHCDCH